MPIKQIEYLKSSRIVESSVKIDVCIYLASNSNRTLDNRVHAKDGRLRQVDDGHG